MSNAIRATLILTLVVPGIAWAVDNRSTAEQSGEANEVRIFQASTWSGHTASVAQEGQNNRAAIDQSEGDGAWLDSNQIGSANNLRVEQTGDMNSIGVSQEGVGNDAQLTQRWASGAGVVQRGTGNSLIADQISPSGMFSGIGVLQEGTDNRATISQGGGDIGTFADLQQRGEANDAHITQGGDGGVWVTQDGVVNRLDIDQSGISMNIYGSSTGDRNEVTIRQQDWNSGLSYEQTGNDNLLEIDQRGTMGTYVSADITQLGDFNQARVSQQSAVDGIGGNHATILQTGTGNLASAVQQ